MSAVIKGEIQDYLNQRAPIFPVFGISNGICHCSRGNSCPTPGKHPITKAGFKNASSDPEVISRWHASYPNCNWAMATGKLSEIFVFDVDPRNGGLDTLNGELKGKHFPPTPTVKTGGGGSHSYYLYPKGPNEVRCGELYKGIDVKANGGYVLIPPSAHKSGRNYEWMSYLSWKDIEVSPPPEWLLKAIENKLKSRCSQHHYGYWSQYLSDPIQPGARHDTLVRFAGRLSGKNHEPQEILTIIHSINKTLCQPPLEADEVFRIVNWVCKKKLSILRGPQHD